MTVEVVRLRGDIAPGRVQLHVQNDTDAAVSLGDLTLASAALAEPAVWRDDGVTLAPGRAVNLPVSLPGVVCTASASATVSGGFDTGGGPVAFSAAAADPLDVLATLGRRQCDVDAVAAVADVRAAGVRPTADGTAVLEIAVEPVGTGDGVVRLVAVTGTPLLRFAAGEEAPLEVEVGAADAASVVEVVVVPRRCDAHALGEDKVGTLLGLVAAVDGREVEIPLARSQDVADALLDFVGAACGLAG